MGSKIALDILSDTLRFVFDLFLQTAIFSDPLKIAIVTPVFKTGDLKGVLIDLFKAFDTINHAITLKMLENYGIKDTNLT